MFSPRYRHLKIQNRSHFDMMLMLSPHFLHCIVYSHWSAYLHKSFAFCAVDGVYHRLLSLTTMPVCYSLSSMVGICLDTQTINKICRKIRHSSAQPVTCSVNVFLDDVTCTSRELWEILMFIYFFKHVYNINLYLDR